jgi:hypothetical protein
LRSRSKDDGESRRNLVRPLLELSPDVRRELLSVLTSTASARADAIVKFHARGGSATRLAEALIDLELDDFSRAVVVGLLGELNPP